MGGGAYRRNSGGNSFACEVGVRARRPQKRCAGCGCLIPNIKTRCGPCSSERKDETNENYRLRTLGRL